MSTTIKDHTRVDKSAALLGRRVDKYEILEIVGKGGMGCVYAALNTAINKRVAMKCIDHELAANKEANARFQREALAASAIESPHIVQIFDAAVTDDGVPYIVMELLRGEDLGKHISQLGKLDLASALHITAQILKGLQHAHAAGIVHRDLKPDNVFLVRRDDDPVLVKLLDFGVSKIARQSSDVPLQTLTRQGTVVGTPFYMSPEQAQAFPDVDGRTDIYSTGAILYECLTGRPPHVGRAYEQVIVNICMKDAEDIRTRNPDVPDAIADVVHQALSRERDDRYQSAETMLRALIEAAPMSIDVATSSPHIAGMRLTPQTPWGRPTPGARQPSSQAHTPRIVTTPRDGRPANELADTVRHVAPALTDSSADGAELSQSGISQKTVAAETVRSTSDASGTRRRWTLALAPGVALLVAVALWIRAGSTKDDAATVVASDPGDADPKVVADQPPEREDDLPATATPVVTASVAPSASVAPPTPVPVYAKGSLQPQPKAAKPAQPPAVATSAPPKPAHKEEPTPPPELQLQEK